MKLTNIHKIGFVVTFALALLIWGLYFLKGVNIFQSSNTYFVVYEKVDGLSVSSPVEINGYKIGRVSSISFIPGKEGNLLVSIDIRDGVFLPRTTTAHIFSSDLMGTKAVRLIFGDKNENHQAGDTLASDIEKDLMEQVNMQVVPLKNKAESMMLSVDSVLTVVRSVFNAETRDNLTASFASIRTTIKNMERITWGVDTLIKHETKRIAIILANVESITSNLKNNNEMITNVLTNISDVTDSLKASGFVKMINEAHLAVAGVNQIVAKINQGEGSLGSLIHNDTLYYNLEAASYNLNRLIKDLNDNPQRYVNFSVINFGRTIMKDKNEKRRRRNEKKPK